VDDSQEPVPGFMTEGELSLPRVVKAGPQLNQPPHRPRPPFCKEIDGMFHSQTGRDRQSVGGVEIGTIVGGKGGGDASLGEPGGA
jgi:hypothetical protein